MAYMRMLPSKNESSNLCEKGVAQGREVKRREEDEEEKDEEEGGEEADEVEEEEEEGGRKRFGRRMRMKGRAGNHMVQPISCATH